MPPLHRTDFSRNILSLKSGYFIWLSQQASQPCAILYLPVLWIYGREPSTFEIWSDGETGQQIVEIPGRQSTQNMTFDSSQTTWHSQITPGDLTHGFHHRTDCTIGPCRTCEDVYTVYYFVRLLCAKARNLVSIDLCGDLCIFSCEYYMPAPTAT